MTDTERAQLRQLAKEGRVPMPNTIIELIDEVTALQAECEKWKLETATAWQGQEAGSEWNWELKAENDRLEAENASLKDDVQQLKLLLKPINVNVQALEESEVT